MLYKFFANSQKTWAAMYEAISSAKESIYLEVYIFQDDMVEFDFLSLLKEKARTGLKIKIILDSFGSSGLSKKAISEIRESGAELLFLSYFLHRTHRKILVIDEKLAFIGGVNFHQHSSLWNDLAVRVRGKLVNSITRSFAKTYIECGGRDFSVVSKSVKTNKVNKINGNKKERRKVRDWLIEHSPVKNNFRLKKIYINHLSMAKENVTLVTPYFMPKRWLVGLLHQAHLRGVNIHILVPESTDFYFVDRVNYFYMNKLSKLGVDFFLESQMNHAKIMTIDSKEAIVGSNNLDFLSFELNSEIGIFFNDKIAINRISNIVEGWKRDSVLFNTKTYKMRWFDYIISPVFKIFSKIL
jgi:cardiolipin synthase